jgi:hypothetical protein
MEDLYDHFAKYAVFDSIENKSLCQKLQRPVPVRVIEKAMKYGHKTPGQVGLDLDVFKNGECLFVVKETHRRRWMGHRLGWFKIDECERIL